jgi:endoglucanase
MVPEFPISQYPFSMNSRLGRGVNMGNMLEAARDGSWRGSPHLKPEYFPMIKEKGFDSVRIPMRWSEWAREEQPYTISSAFYKKVDAAIDGALACGLAVVMNIHHYAEVFREPYRHQARLLRLWEQISCQYKGYPSLLLFELLNEPSGALTPSIWNEILPELIAAVRVDNPSRTLIVGPGNWNNIDSLPLLKLPEEERNLIVSVHYYLPMRFTHQGATWVPESMAWLGSTWDGTPEQKSIVDADFDGARNWARQHNRPLYLGEFGAYRAADIASRSRWTGHVARTADARGISWAYWEFCAGFGIYQFRHKTWNIPLLKALIPAAGY